MCAPAHSRIIIQGRGCRVHRGGGVIRRGGVGIEEGEGLVGTPYTLCIPTILNQKFRTSIKKGVCGGGTHFLNAWGENILGRN